MSDAEAPRPAATSSPGEQFTVPVPAHREAATRVLPVADRSPRPATPAVPLALTAPERPAAAPDPLLALVGSALLWMTVGWWFTVLVRLLGSLVRLGASPTMLVTNIDHWPEETVVMAVVSVLAAVTLLLGRGPRGRDPLGVAAGLLAVGTVAVAVWRLLP
jgi:hypothetical protein